MGVIPDCILLMNLKSRIFPVARYDSRRKILSLHTNNGNSMVFHPVNREDFDGMVSDPNPLSYADIYLSKVFKEVIGVPRIRF